MILFSVFSGIIVLGLQVIPPARSTPTPEYITLARRYAPQWRFHPSELYWPSTIEYFVAGVTQNDGHGKVVNKVVTTANVADPPEEGANLYLTVDIDVGKKAFLLGQNPSRTSTAVYTFIAPKDNGVVDIYYWLFTPFNEGKKIPVVGEVGDHVGDWERMTVRIVNGIATQVDYHAHSDNGSGTIPWAHVLKFDNGQRPVGYVAKGSHGFWAAAGTFTYTDVKIFKLQDVCADGGVYWDTRDSLISYMYPNTFAGSDGWINFRGYWGNVGDTSCWWYFLHKECKIVTGPDGPYRADVLGAGGMRGPLSHTLGMASSEPNSSFTFYIDASARKVACSAGYTHVAIRQTCTSWSMSIDTADSDTESERSEAEIPAAYHWHDACTTWATSGTIATETDANRVNLAPAACEANFAVTAYAAGLCTDDTLAHCAWRPSRPLRAYGALAHGDSDAETGTETETLMRGAYDRDSPAIVVVDLDNWRW